MVTLKNTAKYATLFQKAWDELYYRDKFYYSPDSEELTYYYAQGNTFNTVEDYFTKINTLITVGENEKYPDTIHTYDAASATITEIANPKVNQYIPLNYEFIMLPLDEPYFEINANTRDITIPNAFKRLVGVQGDHVAETLIFTIDRYFDFVDLYRDDMKIYAQWTDEKGEDKATELIMKYYNPVTKKIVFGWSLHNVITKEARSINFSIRFLIASGNNVTYSLNTKVHNITIAPALQSDFTKVDVDTASNYFLNAINDSPTADSNATIPTFEAPGTDLNSEITDFTDDLKVGTYYVLEVQAVTPDQGYLEYQIWHYTNLDGITTAKSGTEIYKAATYNATKAPNTKYYIREESPVRYVASTEPDADAAEGKQLYERYWTCQLTADEALAGSYSTSVRHRNGNALSQQVLTSTITFPGPGDVAFGAKVNPENCILSGDEDDASVVISTPINRENNNVNIVETWEYSNDNDTYAVMTNDEGTSSFNSTDTSIDLTALTPGWYKATITGTRNGVTTDPVVMTEPYKVTYMPKVPTITEPAYTNDASIVNASEGVYTLTVTLDNDDIDFTNPLESDGVIYKWFGRFGDDADGNYEEIVNTEELRNKYKVHTTSAINTNTLVVDDNGTGSITYYCEAYNILNGCTSIPGTDATNHKSGIFVVL